MVAGHEVATTWSGRTVRAWSPDSLADRRLALDVGTVRHAEQAVASVRRADDRLPARWEPLARLLLRAEGVASSNIEGLRAPIIEVATAELDDQAVSDDAAWVADNLAAVEEALAHARGDVPLAVDDVHRWHRRLMRHGRLPDDMVGQLRQAQGWIGGTSPVDAVYVPPPPEAVGALFDDLVAFVNTPRDLDAVSAAAVAHAQLETIHPYGDGNGRLGRILVAWILVRHTPVSVPPPVSVLIARDPGGYLSGLHAFREGEDERWVTWFAGVVGRAADASTDVVERVGAVVADWRERTAHLRADAAARAALDVLPVHPVLDATVLAGSLGVSERAARSALAVLGELGVVEPVAIGPRRPGRPRRWWVARAVVDEVARWAG